MVVDINDVENIIQYEFKNKTLLKQAFMITDNENIPFSNEVLRTIGKRVINYSLTQILIEFFGTFNERGMFRTKNSNVEFNDLLNSFYSKDIFARNIELFGLSKYINQSDDGNLFNADRKLFEAIIGAVALDSNWNMVIINDVLSFMLDFDYYLDHGFDDLAGNFLVLVYNYCVENNLNSPVFEYDINDKNNIIEFKTKITIYVNKTTLSFSGVGETKSISRMNAAKLAYTYLVENNYVKTLKNLNIEVSKDSAMKQLENLAMEGYFTLPEFDTFDLEDGYEAVCMVDECDLSFKGRGKTDSEAINEAAYKMLNHLLGKDILE